MRPLAIAQMCVVVSVFVAAPAAAQAPDTILVNGKILTVDQQFSTREALAIRDGRIVALDTSANIRKLAGRQTRVIDVQGRTVIPGLIDSHLHAIRAAQTFATEVNWIGAASLTEALGRIAEAARTMKPGAWLIVAGGWNVQQFKENRRPTQAELVAAAPDNPVYVQLGYGWAMLTPLAYKALNITTDADVPSGGKLEKDASGKPTGGISGGQGAIIALFDKLPKPTFDEQVDGTKKFFRELNRLALTGVDDPGGNNLAPDDYQAMFKVWRRGEMTVRVAYTLCGQTPGAEFEELKGLVAMVPQGFGDDMLRFDGLGERITAAMNNNNRPTDAEKEQYYQIVRWAAARGMTLTMHWNNDASVGQLLDIFERVNKDVPIAPLRWSIAHLNDASAATLHADEGARRRLDRAGRDVLRRRGLRAAGGRGRGEACAAGRNGQEDRRGDWRRHRRAPRRLVQPVHVAPVVPRRQDRRRHGDSRTGGDAGPRRRAALLHDRQRLVFVRREEAGLARSRQAGRPGRAVEGLHDRAGGTDVHTIESVLTMVGGKVVYAAGPFANSQ